MYSIYSLDQQTIISASSFGGVLIQSTLTGKHERYVASRYFGQTSIAISPDRLRMAAGDSNFNVHITNIESGLIEFVLAGHTQSIEAIAFSPRSDIVATGSRDATVRLWSMDSGDIVRELDSHAGVKALEFSPDGQQIASVSQDDAVILWEVETGEMKEFYAKKNAQHSFTHVGFSPISAQITACDSKNNHIIIWIPSSNEPRHILKHDGSVNTFVWSCCEQWIVTYHPNSAWVWKKSSEKAIDWTCVTVIRGLYEPFNNIEWRPNALEFVTGCSKGAVRVWRLVEKMGVWSVQLVWSTQSDVLVASETQLSNVIGLSALNQQLLEQRKSG
ncbi:hypothetical protein FBU30_005594 [Linnemannia zychae]|nr:hypothetical protein FBU30_005594 [Linnemannia zychae]